MGVQHKRSCFDPSNKVSVRTLYVVRLDKAMFWGSMTVVMLVLALAIVFVAVILELERCLMEVT